MVQKIRSCWYVAYPMVFPVKEIVIYDLEICKARKCKSDATKGNGLLT